MERINPYNFVGLGKNRSKGVLPTDAEPSLTGVITCDLQTDTPLITLGEHEEFRNGHRVYKPFTYDGKTPIIPGSAIRGVLRSTYEALTNSCLSTLENRNLSTRVNKQRNPGLLFFRDGQYFIVPATRYMVKTGPCAQDPGEQYVKEYDKHGAYLRKKDGQMICRTCNSIAFDRGDIYRTSRGHTTRFYLAKNIGSGTHTGVLLIGETFQRKHHDSIFYAGEGSWANKIPVSQEAVNGLKAVIDIYRDQKINNHLDKGVHHGYIGYDIKMAQSDIGLPVWYLSVENYQYLAPGCMSRNVYFKKLTEIAQAQGGYAPCKSRKDICEACALFGMVGDDEALGGRIRVSDAEPHGECKTLSKRTLPPLMGPKLSTLEFYTVRPSQDDDLWNYDYATRYNQQGRKGPETQRMLKPGELRLRGRKYFWHHEPDHGEQNQSKFNITVEPIAKNMHFQFQVFFNRITETELKRIVALMNLDGQDYGHKIGHAKPYGYGSVMLSVKNIAFRSLSLTDSGSVEYRFESTTARNNCTVHDAFKGSGHLQGLEETMEILRRKHDWPNRKVDYPRDQKGNIYGWFSSGRGSVSAPKACPELQTISEIAGKPNQENHAKEPIKEMTDDEKKQFLLSRFGKHPQQRKNKDNHGHDRNRRL